MLETSLLKPWTPADIFATLIEQTKLLLGQVSLSILYARCLNILKILLKEPRKNKDITEGRKQPYCTKMKVTYLAKNFVHAQMKLNAQGKSLFKSFLG